MFALQHVKKVILKQRLEGNLEGIPYRFAVKGVAPYKVSLSLSNPKFEASTKVSSKVKGEIRDVAKTEMNRGIRIVFTIIERRTRDSVVAYYFASQRRIRREGGPPNRGIITDETEVKGAWQR